MADGQIEFADEPAGTESRKSFAELDELRFGGRRSFLRLMMTSAGECEQAGRAALLKAPQPFADGGHGGSEESRSGLDATLFGALDQPQTMVVGVFHLTHQIKITDGSSHDAANLLAACRPALPPAGRQVPTASSRSNTSTLLGGYDVSRLFHLEQILDKYTLAIVEINAESRVKVQPGRAKPELVEAGARIFLVKVINKAGVTAPLVAESPNALPVFVQSDSSPEPPKKISAADTRDRWMGLQLYDKDPMSSRLSGLPLEYRILQIYSREQGQRSAAISFNVGQGTQDIGFRNEMVIVFTAQRARPLRLWVRDENGTPSMAAFTIRDALGRLYPNPAKRLAPDLFFQPQVYRENG